MREELLRRLCVATGGHVTDVEAADAAEVGPWLPATSCTAFAFKRATTVPAPEHTTETDITMPDDAAGVKTHPLAVPVFEKLEADNPEIDSLNVSVYDTESEFEFEFVAADHDTVGGVVSAGAGTVTEIV
jgi:hypothetical protein